MKIIGLIPARMGSSRFPGKPLYKILGKPMIEHVYERAKLYTKWTKLGLTTCDDEIASFGKSKSWDVIMTSDKHVRCLDRIAEAVPLFVPDIEENDIVVCVQGDEPMLYPDMIDAVTRPLLEHADVNGTVLAMDIHSEEIFRHKDTVKLVHDLKGDVLYTSRAPIPWCEKLTPEVGAKRISGIFAFRWHFLKKFTSLPESPLELIESCDSNRMFDNGLKQRVAPFRCVPSFSVDNPGDIKIVEEGMKNDPYLKFYS